MNRVDLINACFEGGGAVLLTLNVRRILRDKSVQGISLIPTFWWTAWGFWNVAYYHAVACPVSMWAGVAVVSVNAVWVGLALHYKWRESGSPVGETLECSTYLTVCQCDDKPRLVIGGSAYFCRDCGGAHGL